MALIQMMIVEDEALVAMRQMMDLSAEGFLLCGWVSSGEEAVELAREKRPDVALMDVRLTGSIDGIEVLRRIRQFSQMPVVFVTGYSDDALRAQVMALPPTDYLIKPVESREIVAAVHALMGREGSWTGKPAPEEPLKG